MTPRARALLLGLSIALWAGLVYAIGWLPTVLIFCLILLNNIANRAWFDSIYGGPK